MMFAKYEIKKEYDFIKAIYEDSFFCDEFHTTSSPERYIGV